MKYIAKIEIDRFLRIEIKKDQLCFLIKYSSLIYNSSDYFNRCKQWENRF